MTNKQAKELIIKYKAGNCTAAEKDLLNAWYIKYTTDSNLLLNEDDIERAVDEIWAALPVHEKRVTPVKKLPVRRIAAAAAVLFLFLSIGFYFFSTKHFSQNIYHNDVAPGGNKAILTLADGSKINLSDARIGDLSKAGPVKITKAKDGQIVYTILANRQQIKKAQFTYNTIATPRGGQYQVILPDGSHVWLNAASSIRFPTVFSAGARKVDITGEVYFEVAKKINKPTGKRQPFIVTTDNQQVEVLGTHFNINAYKDESATKTTLLEGSVNISNLQSRVSGLLKPGQQSIIAGNGLKIAAADTLMATAWKNGQFQFRNASLKEVMRQAERWYNVDVEYPDTIADYRFVGAISRNLPASKFLTILSYTGVKFKIEDKKIIVIK